MKEKQERLTITLSEKNLKDYKKVSSQIGVSMSALARLSMAFYSKFLKDQGLIVDDDDDVLGEGEYGGAIQI